MKIYGLEKLSMVDFGSLCSAVIFTGGCNFRCPFCHNSGLVNLDVTPLDEQEVFDYLISRKKLLDGVVVSGGEPTLYPDLPEFIKKIKDLGYKVKLDTNGTNCAMLKKLIDEKLVDFVAMDIKNSLEMYPLTAGTTCGHEDIVKSIELLKTNVVDYEFRTTLVDGLHTNASIKEMGELVKGAKKLYLQKFVDNGTTIKDGLKAVPKDKAEEYKNILSNYVTSVSLRGY